jgi:hypothetical protein
MDFKTSMPRIARRMEAYCIRLWLGGGSTPLIFEITRNHDYPFQPRFRSVINRTGMTSPAAAEAKPQSLLWCILILKSD